MLNFKFSQLEFYHSHNQNIFFYFEDFMPNFLFYLKMTIGKIISKLLIFEKVNDDQKKIFLLSPETLKNVDHLKIFFRLKISS